MIEKKKLEKIQNPETKNTWKNTEHIRRKKKKNTAVQGLRFVQRRKILQGLSFFQASATERWP